MKMEESFQKGRKQSGKEKLLVTSNFSFFHIIFKRFVLQTRKNKGLLWKGLTHTDALNPLPDDKLLDGVV